MYFTPPKSIDNNESLVLIHKPNESIRNDDCSISNNINNNTNTFNIEDSINILNTNSCINETSDCINKSAKSTKNLDSSLIDTNISVENVVLKSPVKKYDYPPNHTDINESNILNNVCATSLINCNLQNLYILNNECTQEIENITNPRLIKFSETENTKSIPCESIKNVEGLSPKGMNNVINSNVLIDNKNEFKEKNSNLSLKINNSLSEANNTSLPEKMKSSNNLSKPIKLNMVTTEPYPKYTPRVEKAIKKYENKQPKKECYVM